MVLLRAAVRRFHVFRHWCEQCRTFTWCWGSFPLLHLSVHLSVIRWSAVPPCRYQNKHKHFICSLSDGFEVPSFQHGKICNFSFTLTLWTWWKAPIWSFLQTAGDNTVISIILIKILQFPLSTPPPPHTHDKNTMMYKKMNHLIYSDLYKRRFHTQY